MKIVILAVMILGLSACGKNGQNGAQGLTGSQGAQGIAGVNGVNGSSCSVSAVTDTGIAPNGGSLITCTDGTSSLVLNGTNGHDGTNGVNGSSGTVITPVQFCSGVPSYPSVFAESGVCIAGVMYGVYSANGGFLAMLPNGTYSSNGINSSCTFTITGCTVTR